MRLLLATIAMLWASPALAWTWCNAIPAPVELTLPPTVPFKVWHVPREELVTVYCYPGQMDAYHMATFGGCEREVSDGFHFIYIRDDVSPAEQECILIHEKAHLPPNNWKHFRWPPRPTTGFRRVYPERYRYGN